jgi:hypothetical protein
MEDFIAAVTKARTIHPNMRIGQLLVVAAGNKHLSASLFHMSDAELTEALRLIGRVER